MADEAREQKRANYAARQALFDTAKISECSVCARGMDVRLINGKDVISCPIDATHQGYRRLRSLSQLAKAGVYIPYVSELVERRRIQAMEKETGNEEETRALLAYGTERFPMTVSAAERAIRALWPEASQGAKDKALLICAQNNLNPLMHEIYIVHFAGKADEDVIILGIEGQRKLARRRSPYTYKDGPRPLSAQEMEDMGEDPKAKIGVICVLETPGGGQFPGFGFWPKGTEPYGSDKGNTKFTMAAYRAERQALKRIVPDAELPAPMGMVIEGVFVDISDIGEDPSHKGREGQAPRLVKGKAETQPQLLAPGAQPGRQSGPKPASPTTAGPVDVQAQVERIWGTDGAQGLLELSGVPVETFIKGVKDAYKEGDLWKLTQAQRDKVERTLRERIQAKKPEEGKEGTDTDTDDFPF